MGVPRFHRCSRGSCRLTTPITIWLVWLSHLLRFPSTCAPPMTSPPTIPPLVYLHHHSPPALAAVIFLSSQSAALPSPPSQSASHCWLNGVVMVTMATVRRMEGGAQDCPLHPGFNLDMQLSSL
ncbi:unnamed protein product [Pleuronectes platessa]|uniref:Uncharacterized protein n=1 Tax=Pleuronectes platessa TaxID=8262 RepID=A0A9N7TGT4_PLEPL|nr:unnamed protein product [Pleuronectes platessa]